MSPSRIVLAALVTMAWGCVSHGTVEHDAAPPAERDAPRSDSGPTPTRCALPPLPCHWAYEPTLELGPTMSDALVASSCELGQVVVVRRGDAHAWILASDPWRVESEPDSPFANDTPIQLWPTGDGWVATFFIAPEQPSEVRWFDRDLVEIARRALPVPGVPGGVLGDGEIVLTASDTVSMPSQIVRVSLDPAEPERIGGTMAGDCPGGTFARTSDGTLLAFCSGLAGARSDAAAIDTTGMLHTGNITTGATLAATLATHLEDDGIWGLVCGDDPCGIASLTFGATGFASRFGTVPVPRTTSAPTMVSSIAIAPLHAEVLVLNQDGSLVQLLMPDLAIGVTTPPAMVNQLNQLVMDRETTFGGVVSFDSASGGPLRFTPVSCM